MYTSHDFTHVHIRFLLFLLLSIRISEHERPLPICLKCILYKTIKEYQFIAFKGLFIIFKASKNVFNNTFLLFIEVLLIMYVLTCNT